MPVTRRAACLLMPFVNLSALASPANSLPSSAHPFEDMHPEKDGSATYRDILEGTTHTGDYLEVHETVLDPGAAPHPLHRHIGEELFLISSGSVDFTINGKTTRLPPGSAVFVASNDEHQIRNAGSTPAQYFVVTLGAKAG